MLPRTGPVAWALTSSTASCSRHLISYNNNTQNGLYKHLFSSRKLLDSQRKQSPLSKISTIISFPSWFLNLLTLKKMLVSLKAILAASKFAILRWNYFLLFLQFLVSLKPRHSQSVMPLLSLFPLCSVISLGLRHALCIQFAKIELLVQIYILYKLLWHKQQICSFKKIYKYPFLLYKYLQYPTHFIKLTVQGLPHSALQLPPPLQISTRCVFTFPGGGSQRRRAPPQEESVQGEGGGGQRWCEQLLSVYGEGGQLSQFSSADKYWLRGVGGGGTGSESQFKSLVQPLAVATEVILRLGAQSLSQTSVLQGVVGGAKCRQL